MKRVITEYVRREGDEYVKVTTIADYTALDAIRDKLRSYREQRAIAAEGVRQAKQRRIDALDLRI
jgi:hypothetical protein